MQVSSVLPHFGLDEKKCTIQPFGSGLINSTWKVVNGKSNYILQKVNHHVFKQPGNIADNIRLISDYLKKHHPDYLFTSPIQTSNKQEMFADRHNGYFRLFPFIPNAHTFDTVQSPEEASEAARQFARFTKLLSGFDSSQLKITLPDFHNLSLRYRQFEQSLQQGNWERVAQSSPSIDLLKEQAGIVKEFEQISQSAEFKLRVTHHDTKISNILFGTNNRGLCVIDLDTVMPGYFISDVGDMMRTYLSPVSEEEKDFSKIEVRDEYFQSIVKAYLEEMGDELTSSEKKYFVYAGKFLIYMQALRFLTDYFNNDVYYGAKYPDHNLIRANNQIVLLHRLLAKEEQLKSLIN